LFSRRRRIERIKVFDTTLRDGQESPGANMTPAEKLRMASELDELGVDVIEVGFPGSSPQDFEATERIARQLRRPVIAALARAHDRDIDRAAEALSAAERPRIRTFIATSDHHLQHKLHLTRESCLEHVHEAVSHAKRHMQDVEFSALDATRTDPAFLCRVMEVAIDAGATTINVPDTVGYAVPNDFTRIIGMLFASVQGIDAVTVSVHCHNDLGLAVANVLAAIQSGARQVQCTVNGIGPRAGNTPLEEVVVALRVRPDLGFDTGVRTERLYPASQLLAHITGIRPLPNKAVVGEGVFAHEADVREGGLLENPSAYEIITPEMVGARRSRLVLGRNSGRKAMEHRLNELGYELDPDQVERAYEQFRMLAESQKTVLDEDLLAIYYQGTIEEAPPTFRLESLHVECGRPPSKATVSVSEGGGRPVTATAEGDGPIDATFAALQEVIPWEVRLESFEVHAASPGTDAVGEARLHLRVKGHVFTGRAASTDIVDAAARAFLNAIDKASHTRDLEARALESHAYWGV
jgi:2-isopropylmalate synthase